MHSMNFLHNINDNLLELHIFKHYTPKLQQYKVMSVLHLMLECLKNSIILWISRHTVVCRAAQEAGAPHREYIDRKNENVIFTPLYLGDHLSDWNQICYTVARQPRESTFQI